MDDVIQKVIAALLALGRDVDGRDAARIDDIIERLLRDQDPHGQHAARLYARLGDQPLPQPAEAVSPAPAKRSEVEAAGR